MESGSQVMNRSGMFLSSLMWKLSNRDLSVLDTTRCNGHRRYDVVVSCGTYVVNTYPAFVLFVVLCFVYVVVVLQCFVFF